MIMPFAASAHASWNWMELDGWMDYGWKDGWTDGRMGNEPLNVEEMGE
jgi:hypothetical protein